MNRNFPVSPEPVCVPRRLEKDMHPFRKQNLMTVTAESVTKLEQNDQVPNPGSPRAKGVLPRALGNMEDGDYGHDRVKTHLKNTCVP